ncbi:GTP-binding protein Obg/CgtA, partial [Cristinia sonorae]
ATAESIRRKRRTDWKRRQGGQTFLDHTVIHVRAGKGGNGCVAFHREKFVPYGPPSGGNGGRGGDVYIQPTPHLTTLSTVPVRVRGATGGTGQGSWLNGKNAEPTIVKVPLGTIVRELSQDDPRRAKNEYEAEEEGLEDLDIAERRKKLRANRWVHYPEYEEDNVQREEFKEAERTLYRDERMRRVLRKQRMTSPIYLDLDVLDKPEDDPNAPLGLPRQLNFGHLLAHGGAGGFGNPHFLGQTNRSPKFATRGYEGEWKSFSLELKLLADVGLVGMPNAGKSTLLRALTAGRAKTEVAGYAFTTLNPVVAVVRVAEDGSFEGQDAQRVYDETLIEERRADEAMEVGREYEEPAIQTSGSSDFLESFRFTVADNPGLIEHASDNVGLGHSFLRSIERSPVLVYVVDLSSDSPWDDLRILKQELEAYKPGMSPKARMVIANKADLLGGDGQDDAAVHEAKEKLRKLEDYVKNEMVVHELDVEGCAVGERRLVVVPISAKYSMNVGKVVELLRDFVQEARLQK